MMRVTIQCDNSSCTEFGKPMTADLAIWGPSFRESQKEGGRRPFYLLPQQIFCGCGYLPIVKIIPDPDRYKVETEGVPGA